MTTPITPCAVSNRLLKGRSTKNEGVVDPQPHRPLAEAELKTLLKRLMRVRPNEDPGKHPHRPLLPHVLSQLFLLHKPFVPTTLHHLSHPRPG